MPQRSRLAYPASNTQAACTAAVAEAIPSGGRTGVPTAGPDRDSAVLIAYRTGSVARQDAYGPVLPKSLTSMATR